MTKSDYSGINGIWVWFVPLLVVSSGLFIGGYAIIDEVVLILAILIGSKYVGRNNEYRGHLSGIHKTVFNILVVYFIFEAIRGAMTYYYDDGLFEALRKVRWVVMFVSIGILNNIIYPLKRDNKSDKIIINTLIAGIIYFVFYIGYGVVGQLVFSINRYQLQFAQSGNIFAIWTTTAYAMYPIVVVLPAIYICLKQLSKQYHKYAYFALLAIFYATLYYDSRSGIIVVLVFTVILLFKIRKDKVFYVLIICLAAFFIYMGSGYTKSIEAILDDLMTSGSSLWSFGNDYAARRDLDRTIHIVASLNSIGESIPAFLFGYGYAVSGKIIGYHFYDLAIAFENYKFGGDISNFGTEFIPALIVDSGVVGFILVFANVLLSIFVIISDKGSNNKLLLVVMTSAAFLWGFVINIHDAVLFYCILMPRGIMFQFAGVGRTGKDNTLVLTESEK